MQQRPHAHDLLLAVVPARAGSRGVVGKNLRPLAGIPMIGHTLNAISRSGVAERIVVSTDGAGIAGWCRLHGYEVLERPAALADPSVPIAAVAAQVMDELEWEGILGVFQPTSPLRSADSIRAAVDSFRVEGADSLMSVVAEPHLCWHSVDGDLSSAKPLFKERVNRQYATESVYRETGAIQLIRASRLRDKQDMVTQKHLLFPIPVEESIDIDSHDDFASARRRMERSDVILRFTANRQVGSGHLFHCLQLAEELGDQRLEFLLVDCDDFVAEMIEAFGYPYRVERDLRSSLDGIGAQQGAVLINDVLNTDVGDVLVAKAAGLTVVNIEDMGPGARYADWVVNALYPPPEENAGPPVATGARWATLRSEFRGLPPKHTRTEARRVLVTFGGTDPSGLAERIVSCLAGELPPEVDLRVIQGPGAIDGDFPTSATVLRSVSNMASEMFEADLIITSAGRTVYEGASTGTPVVVLAQNAREATHSHLSFDNGVVFLGVGSLVEDATVTSIVCRLLRDAGLRAELGQRLRSSIDGEGGRRIADQVRRLIREGSGTA